jgi:hypothetical protein
MIEIVSPTRTLRLKGETTAEHRLWSDSLYRLCNPPPVQSPEQASTPAMSSAQVKAPVSQSPPVSEAKREDRRREEREAAAPVAEAKTVSERKLPAHSDDRGSSSRSLSAKETARQVSSRQQRQEEEEEGEDDDEGHSSEEEVEEEEHADAHSKIERDDRTSSRRFADSPPRSARRGEAEAPRPRCDSDSDARSPDRRNGGGRESSRDDSDGDRESNDDREAKSSRRRASSMDSDECEEDDNNRGVRPPQLSKRPSLLVASIKAASPCTPAATAVVAAPQSPKFSEDEDEASSPKRFGTPRSIPKPRQEPIDETDDPQEESPRTNGQDAVRTNRPPSPTVEHRSENVSKLNEELTKRNNEYFDSEDEEEGDDQRHAARPIIKEPPASVTAPRSEVARDNNFVDEDWDAEEDIRPTKASAKHVGGACASVCLSWHDQLVMSCVCSQTSKAPVAIGVGNVAADSNFATEDWDD